MKVYVLMREVDIVGVYASRLKAEAVALKYDLFNWIIHEHEVTA